MFIFTKTTNPDEGNLKAKRFRNSGETLFSVPCQDFKWHMCTTKKGECT